jgi:hypothetical protein
MVRVEKRKRVRERRGKGGEGKSREGGDRQRERGTQREIERRRKPLSRLHTLRAKNVALSVMCADARTRGVECHGPTAYGPCLPLLTADLDDYYLHAKQYFDKIRQDLKDAGCWNVDPRISAGLGAGKSRLVITSNPPIL